MRASLIGFIIIAVTGMIIAFFMITKSKKLDIYSPDQIDARLVDPSLQSVMSGHRIGAFSLTNQYGETITEKNFENKIYVADFFFTTCQGICPKMTSQMTRIQEANEGETDFMILSHTVMPEVDSPAVLLEYANQYGANPEIWQFATGERMNIFNLARKSYFAATLEEEGHEDEMVHTENFVLVDKEKRIRGVYDGTSTIEVNQLINDIELLRSSYE